MVGPVTPTTPQSEAPLSEGVTKGGITGFLSTTVGKVVVGGVIVLVLAGALAAIAFFFVLGQADVDDSVVITPQPPAGASTTATSTEPEPAQRPSPRNEDTFTFRNIFRPTVRPAVPASSTTDASGTAGDDLPANTLFLQSVSVVDGQEVATLLWNGQTFTAAEGDVLAGTPWQVLSIDGSTVVMLFGDSRVTLVVGQGLGK